MVPFRIHRDDKWYIYRSQKKRNNQNQPFFGSENIPVVKVIKKTGDFIQNEIPFFMGWHVDAHPIQIWAKWVPQPLSIQSQIGFMYGIYLATLNIYNQKSTNMYINTVRPMYRSYTGLDHKELFFLFSKGRAEGFVSVSFRSRQGDIRAVDRFSRCHWIQNFNRWIFGWTIGGWETGCDGTHRSFHVSNP